MGNLVNVVPRIYRKNMHLAYRHLQYQLSCLRRQDLG